jgi:hypothetical protein
LFVVSFALLIDRTNYAFLSGGGKDRVELFIERARKNVVASRNSLKTVIDILELDVN